MPREKRRTNRFSEIGGDAALDFVNTRPMGSHGPVERLPSIAETARWCVQLGLMPKSAVKKVDGGPGTLRSIHALREGLRAALEAQHSGKPNWRPLIAMVNTLLARSPRFGILRPTSGAFSLRHVARESDPHLLTALIAERVAQFLASGDVDLVRRCGADDCVLWFVDRTRNHSRQWCRMEGCGARAKARAYYRRKKAKRTK